jgi:hypothetical protein
MLFDWGYGAGGALMIARSPSNRRLERSGVGAGVDVATFSAGRSAAER